MGIVDAEGLPLDLVPGLLRYAPWLFGTVIRANFDVARRILHPRLPITPMVIRVPAEQRTAPGRVSLCEFNHVDSWDHFTRSER